MIPVIIELSNIPPNIKTNQVTREMRHKLVNIIKEFKISIDGFRPREEAVITSGGVKTSEINPKTMQSKLMPSVYFAGEVIDVDAYTGGYNFHCISTGYLGGMQPRRICYDKY